MSKKKIGIIRISCTIMILIVAMVRIYKPNLFKFLMLDRVDTISLGLIGIAMIILFYPKIYSIGARISKKINYIDHIRILIVCICFVLAIVNIFFKEINIDKTSIYLIIIGSVVLMIPDFKDFICSIKKFKKGDLEFEFDNKVNELVNKAEEAEKKINEENINSKVEYSGLDDATISNISQAINDPRGAIMIIAVEIEKKIRNLATSEGIQCRTLSINKMLIELETRGVLDIEVVDLFREFWKVRNTVVHGRTDLDNESLYEIAEIGIKILKLIPTKILNN
ncbi:hypothetical protein QTH30_12705 [Clostridium perfringens]|uniref:hypothetical protein n=4 Tax=Clostridium perfringens TaxID=1502 RepID=UPI000BB53D4F|nr:hypothetical protein [Clostridium perfringens]ATD48258.1 hypothetical protein CMR01_05630 [Clostridium perfringens]MBO3409711.1 hypothetical protein [Clostridium perfringens]MBO3432397.1 hypothetical protein [Clostridium perfringens]MDB2061108.1 hypothetical protein [Clostridium perfringens]MDB2064147.1 hypothetical protein [Clostridium perfringens]